MGEVLQTGPCSWVSSSICSLNLPEPKLLVNVELRNVELANVEIVNVKLVNFESYKRSKIVVHTYEHENNYGYGLGHRHDPCPNSCP